MRRHALTAVALAAAFCAALASGLASSAQPQPGARLAAAVASSSAVTRSGTGPFSALSVTVERTTNLVDQVVRVDWSGGAHTQPDSSFAINYLQIMQCWGDAAGGPTREQCEFGGKAAFDQRGGNFSATRQLNYGTLVDPLEKAIPAKLPPSGLFYASFESVTGKTVLAGNANEFYDSTTTNEIPYARTRGDGKGQEFFETQTAQEAPGLGCGQLVKGAPRKCWLVVVPRGDHEVDGSLRDATSINQLQSSPLSQTNWNNRLVFPLSFSPVGNVCPLGIAERRTVGVEPIDEAFVRWQPVLCANGGAVYGFSQVTDSVANRQVLSDPPGMVFVSSGVPPDQVSPDRPLTYAPMALTGLTISFLIERQSGPNAPPAVKATDGERLPTLNLTPRLVAKLLTQSYVLGVNGTVRYLQHNPADLTHDPDFLAVNPAFKTLQFSSSSLADMLVPESLSKTTQLLWDWIGSDPAARDFLSGQPDPWGTRINPFYQGLTPDREDFPKIDPFCQTFTSPPQAIPGPLCTLDAHPYASDMHEGARAASRGDTLSRSAWDPNALPFPTYKKTPAQLNGRRALIALADTATAARFGLAPAKLQNASGHFVAPTDASMLLGEQAMTQSSVSGVLASAPGTRVSGAYPLVSLTYGATAPTALSQPEASDYAKLIRYAVGAGQVRGNNPGQLPEGYVPLPQALRAQALLAATIVQERKGGTPPVPAAPGGTPGTRGGGGTAAPGAVGGGGSGGSFDTGGSLGAGTGAGTVADSSGSDSSSTGGLAADLASSPAQGRNRVATRGGTQPPTIAAGERTPTERPGAARYVMLIALVLGGLAAAGGPALPLARRRIRR